MKLLLDTNICIYLIKNRPPEVKKYFENLAVGEVGLSTISFAELQYGVAKSKAAEKNARALEAFILPLEILPFDSEAAAVYGRLGAALERQGRVIGSLDLLIAAQALAGDLTLITHNLKEFDRVPGLKCETWVN